MEQQICVSPTNLALSRRVTPIANSFKGWNVPMTGSGLFTEKYNPVMTPRFSWNPEQEYWSVLTPDPLARILEIDSIDDLRWLLNCYGFGDPNKLFVDFRRMAEDWDAVSLTKLGAFKILGNSEKLTWWTSEQTLWFRWKFTSCFNIKPYRKFGSMKLEFL